MIKCVSIVKSYLQVNSVSPFGNSPSICISYKITFLINVKNLFKGPIFMKAIWNVSWTVIHIGNHVVYMPISNTFSMLPYAFFFRAEIHVCLGI